MGRACPCDGVGGAVKRSADTAVKKGQLIKDAKQFFEWGSEQESTSALSFLYVDIDMVAAATTELEAMGKFSVPVTTYHEASFHYPIRWCASLT